MSQTAPPAFPAFPAFPRAPECPVCGRDPGPGIACRFCGQLFSLPSGVRLSSPGRRLGAYLLDGLVLMIAVVIDLVILGTGGAVVTGIAFVGWLVWALVVWARGQTPGKQLLGMRTVTLRSGRRATWGTMLVREFLLKFLLFGLIVSLTLGLGLILYFWLLWDAKRQELWDKMVGTIVVDDRNGVLR